MAKKYPLKSKDGFTLIEIMVAVMIISVVIMALIKMYANNTHIFKSLKQQTTINQYSSFLMANKNYGFEKDETNLYELLGSFDVETDLRRELKNIKIKILYQEVATLDMNEVDVEEVDGVESQEEQMSSGMVFEIGKTVLKTEKTSIALIRLRLQ